MKHVYKVWDEHNSDHMLFTVEAGTRVKVSAGGGEVRGDGVRIGIPLIDPDDWIFLTKNEVQDLVGALIAACLDIDELENAA